MKSKLLTAILSVILVLAMGITASADWKSAYHSSDSSDVSSGKQYLDDIDANIDYPKESDYLKEYKVRYVKPTNFNETVYALRGLNDGGNWKKLAATVDEGLKVTVIAEHSFKSDGVKYTYCCCVYEKDGYEYAGWINNNYLSSKSSKSGSTESKTSKSTFESDLDDIDANIDYPKSSDYLKDYKIRYVKPTAFNETVYALHGLDDGGNWKKLATQIEEETKVVVLAEHSYKSDGVKYTYSCCIFEIDDEPLAGWINNTYLAKK